MAHGKALGFMTRLLLYIFILYGISACKADIKQDINYMWDNGKYDAFANHELISSSDIGALDKIKEILRESNQKEFSLDVYPFQFGPEQNLNIEPIANIHEVNNSWPLGFLTNFSSVEKLSIASVCSFTFKINPENKIKHFQLSSHSCGRISAKESIEFDKFKYIESLHIRRYVFSNAELKGINKLVTLESLTLTDCELDLKYLLNLKRQLRYLNLTDSKVLNWHLLSEFKDLEVLYIGNIENVMLRKKENIDFLRRLKKLRELSVKRNSINSLECIENLPNLEKIYIQKTEIITIPNKLSNRKNLQIIN